jgi:plastocyanin
VRALGPLLLAASAALWLPGAADARRHRPPRPPAPLLPHAVAVAEREWDVHASRARVAAGAVSIAVANTGEDDHDLTVAGPGGVIAGTFLAAGESSVLAITLAPGTYTLYCSLPGHAALGMTTTLLAR